MLWVYRYPTRPSSIIHLVPYIILGVFQSVFWRAQSSGLWAAGVFLRVTTLS